MRATKDQQSVVVSLTPSDRRGSLNAMKDLERIGFSRAARPGRQRTNRPGTNPAGDLLSRLLIDITGVSATPEELAEKHNVTVRQVTSALNSAARRVPNLHWSDGQWSWDCAAGPPAPTAPPVPAVPPAVAVPSLSAGYPGWPGSRRPRGTVQAIILSWLQDHPGVYTAQQVGVATGLEPQSVVPCLQRMHTRGKIASPGRNRWTLPSPDEQPTTPTDTTSPEQPAPIPPADSPAPSGPAMLTVPATWFVVLDQIHLVRLDTGERTGETVATAASPQLAQELMRLLNRAGELQHTAAEQQ